MMTGQPRRRSSLKKGPAEAGHKGSINERAEVNDLPHLSLCLLPDAPGPQLSPRTDSSCGESLLRAACGVPILQ
jgi:hypothetical protein